MEYFNLKTKEIRHFKEHEYDAIFDKELWIDSSIIKNKIVLLTINDYKIFPKDELGLNRDNVLKLLNISEPATIDTAYKIAKYYKVCPYCLKSLEISDNLIIDCRGKFSNIKKMQVDVYSEVSCCSTVFYIPFDKVLGNNAKAEFIKGKMQNNAIPCVLYRIGSKDIEVIIDFNKLLEHCFNRNIDVNTEDDFKILNEIIRNDLYLYIKKNGNIVYENIDRIKMEVLL